MDCTELENAIAGWTRHLRNSRALSSNTILSYSSDISLLVRFLTTYKAEEISLSNIKSIDKGDVRAWFLYRREHGESTRTVARGLAAFKSFLKYLCESGSMTSASDIITMRPPKTRRTLPRPLAIDQINEILDTVGTLKQTGWIIKRDRVILALIYSVGLRISEALSLNRGDILMSSGFMNVVGKGSKVRSVPLVGEVRDVIMDYISSTNHHDSEALFVNKDGMRLSVSSIQKLVKAARKMLGFSATVTPHALRHSCATHLVECGGDLRSIQELLGHSSISSTQIYADVAQRYVSDVYDKCHPLAMRGKKSK
ncbi:MAG: tyrosine recombinase XerC [Holosporales bacterium]|jgi:integrase/recombinase XerC|nr:tyrosine recombinase XerC [Holosporales bacterium]